jgi:hypothetical protein
MATRWRRYPRWASPVLPFVAAGTRPGKRCPRYPPPRWVRLPQQRDGYCGELAHNLMLVLAGRKSNGVRAAVKPRLLPADEQREGHGGIWGPQPLPPEPEYAREHFGPSDPLTRPSVGLAHPARERCPQPPRQNPGCGHENRSPTPSTIDLRQVSVS